MLVPESLGVKRSTGVAPVCASGRSQATNVRLSERLARGESVESVPRSKPPIHIRVHELAFRREKWMHNISCPAVDRL